MCPTGLTFIYEDNPYLLGDLNTFNNLKLWFEYLKEPITDTLQESRRGDSLSVLLDRLSRKTYLLVNWCVPETEKQQYQHIYQVKDWIPCGYVQIIQGITSNFSTIRHKVNHMFHLQIHFQLFELDFAKTDCEDSSALYLCRRKGDGDHRDLTCPRGWRYCGYRKPWLLTVPYSTASVHLKQINVLYPCNITYAYTLIEKQLSQIYIKHDTRRVYSWSPNLPVYLTNNHRFIDTVLTWVILVPLGYVQHFLYLESYYDEGILQIYEGDDRYHQLLQRYLYYEDYQELDVISRYFLCNVQYYRSNFFDNQNKTAVFRLRYIGEKLVAEYLSVDKSTTFNNKEDILYAIYVIEMTEGGFPNISVTTRTFQGWNQDHCYYGGYLLHHSIKSDNLKFSYSQGPFCSKSLPSQPFIGSQGPKSVILGNFKYFLVVFAFGPLYDIDIDIIMQISKCEGLFEPMHLCAVPLTEKDLRFHRELKVRRYIKGAHFTLVCSAKLDVANRNTIMHSAEFFGITKCVIFQRIALFHEHTEIYTFQGKINIEITVVKGPTFWRGAHVSASHRSEISIGSLNLHTEQILLASRNMHTFKKEVGIVVLRSRNQNEHLRYYTMMKINTINSNYSKCIVKKDQDHINGSHNKNTVSKVLRITNFCGSLHCGIQTEQYVFQFNLHSHKTWEKRFMYLKFKSSCTEPDVVTSHNILTVITVLTTVSHSVNVMSKEFCFNHYFMPLAFVYDNVANCSFNLEYRLRYFRISTLYGMMPNMLWSAIQVGQGIEFS